MTDDHLSLDELAELDEGLLSPEQTIEARAHLAGCVQCRARADAIASTRATLSSLPPVAMPDEVKERLDRALADASPRATTVVPRLDDHRRKRFNRPTMASSAAAAAIVLVIVAIVIGIGHNPSTSSGGASGGSGAATSAIAPVVQPKNYVRTSTGLNYNPTNLLTDVPGLVATIPGAVQGGAKVPASGAPVPDANGPEASPSSTHSFSQTLTRQPVPPSLRPLFNSRTRLLRCAAYISTTPNAVPIAVDFGTWTGGQWHRAPSAIFVFRDRDPNVVDVFVTGPTCSGTDAIRTFYKVPLH